MSGFLFFALAALAIASLALWQALRRARRGDFIRSYTLPRGLFEKLQARHPQLSLKDCQLVAQALRQFFLAYLAAGRRPVSMPSQVVDDLWHEFILYTRNYEAFCRQAFGAFMHHTPAAVMGGQKRANAGLRRCWWHCCRAENIPPRKPTRLPLLFAIDAKLAIAGGFHYMVDCRPARAAAADGATAFYCGGDFSDNGFDGGTDGLGDSSGAGGVGGTDGGSDGGGSDGGGDGGSGDGGGDGGGGGCGGGCSS
jgi:hypothetical protein